MAKFVLRNSCHNSQLRQSWSIIYNNYDPSQNVRHLLFANEIGLVKRAVVFIPSLSITITLYGRCISCLTIYTCISSIYPLLMQFCIAHVSFKCAVNTVIRESVAHHAVLCKNAIKRENNSKCTPHTASFQLFLLFFLCSSHMTSSLPLLSPRRTRSMPRCSRPSRPTWMPKP
jgi:hypothetical protein